MTTAKAELFRGETQLFRRRTADHQAEGYGGAVEFGEELSGSWSSSAATSNGSS
jgi:hypothetical protein